MFSSRSDKQLQINIEELIQNFHTSEREYQDLTLDSEYQILVGKEYDGFKQQLGGITTRQEPLRHADCNAVKKLFISGNSQQAVIATVMRKSPALRNMSQGDRKRYEKQLTMAMNSVKAEREKIKEQKQHYGIDTNCRRDINNYLKCMKAEQAARNQGMMIPHLNYRQFKQRNSPTYHKKYVADIKAKVAKQDKLDKERQLKQQQQKQQNKQQAIEQKRQIKRSR